MSLHCGSVAREWPRGRDKWEGEKNLHVCSLDQCTQHKHWLRHLHTFLLLAPLLPRNCRLAAECLAWSVEPSSEQMLGQRKVISTGKWLQALWFGQCPFSPHRADLQLMPQGLRCLCSLWHLFKLHWGKSWSCWSCGSSFGFGSSQGLSTPTWPLLISPALHCQSLENKTKTHGFFGITSISPSILQASMVPRLRTSQNQQLKTLSTNIWPTKKQ